MSRVEKFARLLLEAVEELEVYHNDLIQMGLDSYANDIQDLISNINKELRTEGES